MSFDPAIQSYLVESRELLDVMEQSLLRLEAGADDPDLIHAIFRAAHTIKGTGGIFGFDPIVAFTHEVESVLDRLREGALEVNGELLALLFECCDHIRLLLDPVTRGETLDAAIQEQGRRLAAELSRYLGVRRGGSIHGTSGTPVPVPPPVEVEGGEETARADHWHISLRFGREVLRNGMDPLSFLRYLGQMGELIDVTTLTEGIPPAAEMDPEACYLGFEISLRTDADKEQIEGAFEFVRDDCQIRILPPHSKISEYIALIEELPESPMLLGEILVKSKALTRTELERGLEMQANRSAVEVTAPPIGEILVGEGAVDAEVVAAALGKQQQAKARQERESRYIRVDADKLEQLINLVGELVIGGANIQLSAQQAGVATVIESAAGLMRLVEEVRDSALGLRMVQIGSTFQKFQRVVRDVSRELGKDVELVVSGAETELDKSVVEQIGDPLMHLVRNAIDHGIEPVEVREAAGKSPKAKVGLNAYHDSGSIVIEVSDDGRGLDREKIIAKAVARGLVNPNQPLSDQDVYRLIFEPGFSTAEAVSNLSGRGVGMDVVKSNVEALRGTVQIESRPGKGSTVRIRLPLTLAIIDGFLVGIGCARYVIPMDMLVECLEHSGAERAAAALHGYLNVRGEVLPILRLSDLFGIDGSPVQRENVVVVRFGELRAGLVVEELLGEFQTVIKPLGDLFSHLTAISGSTILGSGEVALILNVPGLLHMVMNQSAARCYAAGTA